MVNARIQNGDFTERGLARVLGISQPQIHNVLKGARKLRPELADRVISNLEMTVLDLLQTVELGEHLQRRSADVNECGFGGEPAVGFHIGPKRLGSDARRKPSGRAARRFGLAEEQAG